MGSSVQKTKGLLTPICQAYKNQLCGVPRPSRHAAADATVLLGALETSGFQKAEAGQDDCRRGHDGGGQGANHIILQRPRDLQWSGSPLLWSDCLLLWLGGLAILPWGLLPLRWSGDPLLWSDDPLLWSDEPLVVC